jgi:hypothetical protein
MFCPAIRVILSDRSRRGKTTSNGVGILGTNECCQCAAVRAPKCDDRTVLCIHGLEKPETKFFRPGWREMLKSTKIQDTSFLRMRRRE